MAWLALLGWLLAIYFAGLWWIEYYYARDLQRHFDEAMDGWGETLDLLKEVGSP